MNSSTLHDHPRTAPARDLFAEWGSPCACWFALTLPWSLTLSYVGLFPLLILWLVYRARKLPELLRQTKEISVPFLFLILSFTLSSAFGVDPLRSLRAIPATLFFALSVFPIRELVILRGPERILWSLFAGQSIAAFHSTASAAFPSIIPKLFIGPVSESGQLAITILLTAGLLLSLSYRLNSESDPSTASAKPSMPLCFATSIVSIAWLGFAYLPSRIGTGFLFWPFAIGAFGSLCAVLYQLHQARRLSAQTDSTFAPFPLLLTLHVVVLPLLLTALVVNLKRGPWMGVFVGGTILLLLHHRRLLLPAFALLLVGFFTIEPVRQRIAGIPADFYIAGGRSIIWDIGVELSTRYPLGVGLRNSRFLQTFSAEIPHSLDHFHNNYLNLVVEGGWLSLVIFLWWVITLLRSAFCNKGKNSFRPLLHAIGCALIAWQVAGLVEYNWGDSEVRMLVFIVIGVLLGITHTSRASAAQSAASKPHLHAYET